MPHTLVTCLFQHAGASHAAADFCATTGFQDMELEVCVPKIAQYDSGRDFIQHYITYKECDGLSGNDCSDARAFLFSGMNCTQCGPWADLSAINEANCTSKKTREACIGVDETGHVFEEKLGGPEPGAIVPASDLDIRGEGYYDDEDNVDTEANGVEGDAGDSDAPVAAAAAQGSRYDFASAIFRAAGTRMRIMCADAALCCCVAVSLCWLDCRKFSAGCYR